MSALKKNTRNLMSNIWVLASGFAIVLLHISGLLSAMIAMCHFLILLVILSFISAERKECIKDAGIVVYIISILLSFSWAKLFFSALIKKEVCVKILGTNTNFIVATVAVLFGIGSLYAVIFFLGFFRLKFVRDRKNENRVVDNNRLNSLQGLRAVAFIAVFISHTSISPIDGLGGWGVSVFFCLSGFLMMYNYLPRQARPQFGFRFALTKIKKIYPLYIVTMLVAFATNALTKTSTIRDMMLQSVFNILLLQAWVPKASFYFSLNGVAWYLSAAAFAYFCFPLVLQFADKYGKIRHSLVLFVLFAAEILISVFAMCFGSKAGEATFSMHWITYICPIARVMDFLIGCCLGAMYLKPHPIPQKWFSSVAEILTFALISISLFIYTSEKTILGAEFVKYTLLFSPSSALLIWLIACGNGVAAKALLCSLLVKVGNISAYTYLIHMVIIRLCNMFLRLNIDDSLDLVICAAIAFFWSCILAKLWKQGEPCFPWNNSSTKLSCAGKTSAAV